MNLTLSLSSSQLDDDDLQALTRQLCNEINRETDINADLVAQDSENSKGKLLELGTIALSFALDSGKVAAAATGYMAATVVLIELIRMYLDREPSLQFEVQRTDGTRVIVHCKNVAQMERILATLQSPESESSSAE